MNLRAKTFHSLALIAAVSILTLPSYAQSTNKPSAGKNTAAGTAEKKPAPHPFHGKLTGIDKAGKTITVGKTVYRVTSETKIKKDGQPAMLEDGVLEQEVTGYVKPDENGKLYASSVNFGGKSSGPKTEGKPAAAKKANPGAVK